MLSLNGVSAWVEVDGEELEQYGVEEDPEKRQVYCWIASQVNKPFSVVFRDDAASRDHSLVSSVRLDGASVNGRILFPPPTIVNSTKGTRTIVQKDCVSSATSARPFVFSKLELTDEDEYLGQTSAHLGEIEIRLYKAQRLDSYVFSSTSNIAGPGKVHERSKKAVTHCVSYGQEVETAMQYTTRVRYLDGSTPLVTFVFKYRDFGLLQANGIIPQPPPVETKAAVSDDVLDLTVDNDIKPEPIGDEVEIVDNVNLTHTKASRSKRSNPSREKEGRPAKKIKREKLFVDTGEVIDLT